MPDAVVRHRRTENKLRKGYWTANLLRRRSTIFQKAEQSFVLDYAQNR